MLDSVYTNGVIAVREKLLLGDKLLRYCEMTEEEVLRALKESGFASGENAHDGEEMCNAEECALDLFVREYAPTNAELGYLLAPRDFHNAKAVCKANLLGSDAEKLLAPEGNIPVANIRSAIESGGYGLLGKTLGEAVKEVFERENITGAEIGAIFDIALYKHLSIVCKGRPLLKKLLAGRADRLNILTALRSPDREFAERLYVDGGILKKQQLAQIFDGEETMQNAFNGTPYADFYGMCLAAKANGMPFTQAERALDSFEAEFFFERRFELEGKEPFLYYVFRRRAEIQNVRIICVCLNAGLNSADIKRRLRVV